MCVYNEGCKKDAEDLSSIALPAPSTCLRPASAPAPSCPPHQILTLRPRRAEAIANQNIWPWWKCLRGWLGTMALSFLSWPPFPMAEELRLGTHHSHVWPPRYLVTHMKPPYAEQGFQWSFRHRNTHTTKNSIPSTQSAGAQPEAEHLSPVALLLLDVKPIFLPSLPSENTQVAGQAYAL